MSVTLRLEKFKSINDEDEEDWDHLGDIDKSKPNREQLEKIPLLPPL